MTTVVLNTVTRKVEVFSSARDILARAEIADHKAAANPHPQYLADADLAEVALSGDAGDLASGTVPDARMPNWTGYSVASRTALQAANVPAAVVGLRLLGHATAGDGGGAHYKRVGSEPAHPHKIQSNDGAWWEELFAVDVTVNIPSDFATLQEAIDRLSKQPVRRGARIILNIESGHSPASGINVANGDYGRFWIQSEDAEVTLSASWPDSETVIRGDNARLPVLDCLINANSKGQVGIWANNGSTVYVTAGSGIKNMGNAASGLEYAGAGLRVAHGSRAAISQTIFSGANGNGIIATQGATVHASEADFSNAGQMALFLSRGTVFHGHDMNLSGAALSAVRTGRCYASVRGSNCQNAGEYGIWAFEGSIVAARGANCSGAGISGVHAFQGGAWVDIDIGTVSNCTGSGIVGRDGSTINAAGATIEANGGHAIDVDHGCTLSARNATIDGTGGDANTVMIAGGSRASLGDATITGSPGNGVRVEDGSLADVAGASVTGSASFDLSVARGSIISADGATYGSASQTVNKLRAAGVIFDTTATHMEASGSFTPTFTFSTPGDLSVVYTIQVGRYERINGLVHFALTMSWTPTYTTASGVARIGGLPATQITATDLRTTIPIGEVSSGFVWQSDHKQIAGRLDSGTDYIQVSQMRNGASNEFAGTETFPSGVTIRMSFAGSYRSA